MYSIRGLPGMDTHNIGGWDKYSFSFSKAVQYDSFHLNIAPFS